MREFFMLFHFKNSFLLFNPIILRLNFVFDLAYRRTLWRRSKLVSQHLRVRWFCKCVWISLYFFRSSGDIKKRNGDWNVFQVVQAGQLALILYSNNQSIPHFVIHLKEEIEVHSLTEETESLKSEIIKLSSKLSQVNTNPLKLFGFFLVYQRQDFIGFLVNKQFAETVTQ